MKTKTQFTQEPSSYTIEYRTKKTDVWMRKNIEEVESEEGNYYQADEVYAAFDSEDAPSESELTENFDDWYDQCENWSEKNNLSLEQLRADVDYISIMADIPLE